MDTFILDTLVIEELKEKALLADDGCPAVDAYAGVFSCLSADFDPFCIDIEKHGRDCPICSKRYEEASQNVLRSRKTESILKIV